MLRALTHPFFPIVAVLLGGAAAAAALHQNVDAQAVAAGALGLACAAAAMSLRNWAVGELERPLLVDELTDLNEVADDLIEAHDAIDIRVSSVEIEVDDQDAAHSARAAKWESKVAEHEARLRRLAEALERDAEATRRADAAHAVEDADRRMRTAEDAEATAPRAEEIDVRRRRPIAPRKPAVASSSPTSAPSLMSDDDVVWGRATGAPAGEIDAPREAVWAPGPDEFVSRAARVSPRREAAIDEQDFDEQAVDERNLDERDFDEQAVDAPARERLEPVESLPARDDVSAWPADEAATQQDVAPSAPETIGDADPEPRDATPSGGDRPATFRESWARRASELRRRREAMRAKAEEDAALSEPVADPAASDPVAASPMSEASDDRSGVVAESASTASDANSAIDAESSERAVSVAEETPPPPSVPADPRRGLLLQPVLALPEREIRAFETVTAASNATSLEADRIALVGSLAALGDLRAVDPTISLFCNVSVASIRGGGLDAALSAARTAVGGVHGLVLELRHGEAIAAWDDAVDRLSALSVEGVGLSCDGVTDLGIDLARFGATGFRFVKIDAAAARNREDAGSLAGSLAEALRSRAAGASLSVVFDRIETRADLDWAEAVDAELGQGLALSGPKTFDLALSRLRQARRRASERRAAAVDAAALATVE